MTTPEFVPANFEVPLTLSTDEFTLEPLTPEHNRADYAAWTSSMDHIHRTPGWETGNWPHDMTLDQNRGDLAGHAADFEQRQGFTYTVLDPAGVVIGCVYIYPAKDGPGAKVSSWVTEGRAELDAPLYQAVSAWLEADWPFGQIEYASR